MIVDEYMKLPYSMVLMEEEEGGFSTSVLELPGCFSQGETADEAVKNTKEAMRNWITATLKQGKVVPVPGRARSLGMVPPDYPHVGK